MMNGSSQLPSYDGNMQISITLSLVAWQQVFTLLTEAPGNWKTINPLIVAIDKQIQDKLQNAPQLDIGRQQGGVLPPGDVRG